MNITPLAIVMVGVGGAAGSSLRYILSGMVQSQTASGFPFGTLLVNLIGCFVIGLLVGISISAPVKMSDHLRLVFATGFCGGFTTFSAFSAETVALVDKGEMGLAVTYITISVLMGLAATFAGIMINK